MGTWVPRCPRCRNAMVGSFEALGDEWGPANRSGHYGKRAACRACGSGTIVGPTTKWAAV